MAATAFRVDCETKDSNSRSPTSGQRCGICTNPPDAASRLVVSYPPSKGDEIMPTTIRLHRVLRAGPEVPEMIPPEACYLGWQESLALLAKLVEAEIKD